MFFTKFSVAALLLVLCFSLNINYVYAQKKVTKREARLLVKHAADSLFIFKPTFKKPHYYLNGTKVTNVQYNYALETRDSDVYALYQKAEKSGSVAGYFSGLLSATVLYAIFSGKANDTLNNGNPTNTAKALGGVLLTSLVGASGFGMASLKRYEKAIKLYNLKAKAGSLQFVKR